MNAVNHNNVVIFDDIDYEEWYAAVDYYNCIAEKTENTETKRNTFSIADMMNK